MGDEQNNQTANGGQSSGLVVIPPDPQFSWVCTNDGWVLGFISQNRVYDIQATTKRNKDGSWSWKIPISEKYGIEPSRLESMKTVYSLLQLEAV